ncbi:MAG: hypothetical protein OWR52_06420 [Acidibacillus sp.]|uniref:Uncharacterized protein n=1 Tax=Sulfoacidibacillus ferrooxidans TaxID=2005001 RepID=A0A9X1V8N2_9BACL|nr:hypothetical protein [Sulfoacidibacillus ferrooxidans]MCI0183167.1 hypothetical protein [Sulfoacidibacillus ferrooxidans]MCY0893123.1 hypothetical protein [Acidibacillus sp.]
MQRQSAREDILAAYNLAHAGMESEMAVLFSGGSTMLQSVPGYGGDYSATIIGSSQGPVVEIQTQGITADGATSSITANVNTVTHSVLSWSSMP